MAGKICAMIGCFNYGLLNMSKSFYSFPKDIELTKKWIAISGRTDIGEILKRDGALKTRSHTICSDHFKEEDFINPANKCQGLKRNAVPSVNIPPGNNTTPQSPERPTFKCEEDTSMLVVIDSDHLSDDSALSDSSTTGNIEKEGENTNPTECSPEKIIFENIIIKCEDTSELDDSNNLPVSTLNDSDSTEDIEKEDQLLSEMKQKLRNCQKSNSRYKAIISKLRKENRLLKIEIKAMKKHPNSHGRRYLGDEKSFALTLYHHCSPAVYSFMREQLDLPCEKSLRRWLKTMEIEPELD